MKVNLVAPWTAYYRKIQELFKENVEIKVVFDEESYEIKIYAADADVAIALAKLLPEQKEFGNVILSITIIPANGTDTYFRSQLDEEIDKHQLVKNVFKHNDAVSYIWDVDAVIPGLNIMYVVFVNKVVQYYTDSLSDPHGLTSTLYQDIAKEIFGEIPGVFFATDVSEF